VPLQDHFRPPLSTRRHWHAFHNAWATYLSSYLNERLPEGYFAENNVQFGMAASDPTPSIPVSILSDSVEVLVFGAEGGPVLAGAVELVSPANKDRPAHRDAFVSKCAACVQQGVGLVVVDVVTERRANLHDELLARLGSPGRVPLAADLYAVAYRAVERAGQTSLDVWQEELALGRTLPTLPLWLKGGLCLPVDLEATYERTCREQRIQANGA
jgi:hypothetical protein